MAEKIGFRRGWTALTGLLGAVPFDQSLGEFVFGGARGGAEREVRS